MQKHAVLVLEFSHAADRLIVINIECMVFTLYHLPCCRESDSVAHHNILRCILMDI
jgi:hypothetical protein